MESEFSFQIMERNICYESSDVALQPPCSLLQGSVLLIFVDSSLNLMSSLTALGGVTNCFISIDSLVLCSISCRTI